MAAALPLIQEDPALDPTTRGRHLDDATHHVMDVLQQAVNKGFTGLAFFSNDPRTASLRECSEFQALLRVACPPPMSTPREFSFDYAFDNPGPRRWTREGATWTETEPGSVVHQFIVMGPLIVKGIAGTEIRRMGPRPMTAFVPDLESAPPNRLMMKKADGSWVSITTMNKVE